MGRYSSSSDATAVEDEELLAALTGVEQRWLALCRAAVESGDTADLLDTRAAEVLATQSRSRWQRDSEDLLLDEEGDGSADSDRLAADFSAARAMAAMAGAVAAATPVEDACAIFLDHGDRAGLHSTGSQLVSADSPIIRGDARTREIALHLLAAVSSPSRGHCILLALELADRRPPTRRVAHAPVLFAGYTAGAPHGEMGWLRVELLGHGPSGLHPDPARMGFLQSDAEFTDGLAEAWNSSRLAESDACVVWSIALEQGAPANAIVGGSIAAALAVLLDDLAPRYRMLRPVRPRKLDPRCAVTAGLVDGDLRPVRGYAAKLEVARRHSLRVVVAADAHETATREAPHDFADRVAAAATLADAIRAARTGINHRLWLILAAIAVVVATVVGIGVQSARVRAAHEIERAESASWFYASVSRLVEGRDPAFAQQLALTALHTHDTLPARSALLDSTARNTPLRIVPPGLRAPVAFEEASQLAAGANGDLFAVGAADGTVQITRIDDVGARGLPRVDTGLGHLRGLAASAQDRLLLAAGDAGVGLWSMADPAGATRLRDLSVDGHAPWSAAISPSGRFLAVGCRDGALFVWELTDDAQVVRRTEFTVEGGVEPIVALSDRMLAAYDNRVGRDGFGTRVWGWRLDDPERGEPVLRSSVERGDRSVGRALSFGPDGRTLAFAVDPPEILRWRVEDPAAPAPMPSVPGFGVRLRHLSFSADGKYLATVDDEQMVRVRDLDSGVFVGGFPSPTAARAVFFRGGRSVVTIGADHAVGVTDAPGPTVTVAPQTWYRFSDGAGRVGWDLLRRWRGFGHASPTEQVGRDFDPASIRRMVLASPDLTRAVTLDTTGIQVWAIEGPDRLRGLGPPIADFSLLDCAAVEFHPDGRLALARDRSGQVELWNIAGETPVLERRIPYPPGPARVAFSPDGRWMALGSLRTGSVRVLDLRDQRAVFEVDGLDVGSGLLSLAVSSTGLLAVGTHGGVGLYELSGPKGAAPRELSSVPVTSVSFSRDSARLAASAPAIGRVDLWDIASHAEVRHYARLTGDQRRTTPTSVAFGAGDATLLETGVDGRVTEWRVDAAAEAERICRTGTVMVQADQMHAYLPGVPWVQPCPGRREPG